MAPRRYGIRSRCALSVTRRGAQRSCASSLARTSGGRWGSSPTSDPSKLVHTQAGHQPLEFHSSSSLAFGKQFWWYTVAPLLQFTGHSVLRNAALTSSRPSSFSPGSHGFSSASSSTLPGVQVSLRRPFSVTTVAAQQLPSTLWAYALLWTFLVVVPLCPLRHTALCLLLRVRCRRLLPRVVLCARPLWLCHRGEMFRMAAVLLLV